MVDGDVASSLFRGKYISQPLLSLLPSYSLSQNGWDTLGSPCPLNVGVQDLVTKP